MREDKNMEQYESPKIEIIVFDGVDVITDSSDILTPEIPANP